MGLKKSNSTYLYICFAAFWCYCFFVSVISPPFLGYYTYDETFIADSGVFLWYGITPRILDWPASPSVLIYGLMFGVAAFYQVLAHLSEISGILDAFVVVDQTAYNYLFDREPYILTGRAIQMLIALVVGLWTLRFIFTQKHPLLTDQSRILISLILVSSHLIWNSVIVLRPEALAGAFFIHILCRLLFSERLERREVLLISLLYGLVVAERLIFFILSPMFFCGIFMLASDAKWRNLRFSIGVFIVSFLAFCPFVLTDPLIIAKAFFGGILAKVNDSPMNSLFNWDFIKTYFENPASYLALGLTFLGIFQLWRERRVFYLVVIGNWLLFLFLVLRSSKIYDPHVLPGALIHLFVIGIGLAVLAKMPFRRANYWAIMIGIVILVGEAVVMVKYHTLVRRELAYHDAIRWIERELPSDATVLSNFEVGLFLAPNNQALDRWIEATEDTGNELKKLRHLMGFNSGSGGELSEESMSLSAAAFAFEDEKLFSIQYRLLRKYGAAEKRKRFDLDLYVEDNTLFYHGVLMPDALERFRTGQVAYFVTDDTLEGFQPIREFTSEDGATVRVYKSTAL